MEIGPNSYNPLPQWSAPSRSRAWNEACAKGEVVASEAERVVPRQNRGDAIEFAELVDRAGEGDRVRTLVVGVKRASVEDVAGNEVLAFGLVESDVPRRVAGSVND
jgi:hypothetical protein